MTVKIKVKDKLEENTLDLSCCDLEDVPVKEIAAVKKGTHLDLSNNQLVRLPETFATLSHIVKLDLSKNLLEELPENIGDLKQLKHLDLYSNKISRLPLSFAELKNLKWLDLKDNPLTEVLSALAGPCSDNEQCQKCATLVVKYYNTAKKSIAQTKQLAVKAAAAEERKREAKRKRKKKKNAEKNSINAEALKEKLFVDLCEESIIDNNAKEEMLEETSYREVADDHSPEDFPDGLCGKFRRSLIYCTMNLVFWIAIFISLVLLIFAVSPIDRERFDAIVQLMEDKTGISFVNYQRECRKHLDPFLDYLRHLLRNVWIFFKDNYTRPRAGEELIEKVMYCARYLMNNTRILIMDTYQRHFGEELVDMDDADL